MPALSTAVWTSLGPTAVASALAPAQGPLAGTLTDVAPAPSDANTIYVAAGAAGVWKTSDGGTSWRPLTDHVQDASGNPVAASGYAIAVSPSDPQTIYAGPRDNAVVDPSPYILKSTDGGASWAVKDLPAVHDQIDKLVVDPLDANTLYVDFVGGNPGEDGIFKSSDGGASWTAITASIPNTSQDLFTDIVLDPTQPQTLYTASTQGGVYKSTDGGTTWAPLIAPNANGAGWTQLALAPASPQVIYLATNGHTEAMGQGVVRMLRSSDGGQSWTDLTAGTPNFVSNLVFFQSFALAVDPVNADRVYAGGWAAAGPSIIESTDGAATWSALDVDTAGQGAVAPHQAFAFDAAGKLLDGSAGGIWRLDDPTPSTLDWQNINTGLDSFATTALALSPADPAVVVAASPVGIVSNSGGSGWTLTDSGGPGAVAFSTTNPSRVYRAFAGPYPGAFRRSDDAGRSWVTAQGNGTIQDTWSAGPLAVDPTDGNHVLFATETLWETHDGGDTWSALAGMGTNTLSTLLTTAIAFAPSDPRTIYLGANNTILVSHDAGASWVQTTEASGPFQFAVDPTDANVAYAAFDHGHYAASTDGGITWQSVDGNLPLVPSLDFSDGAGLAIDAVTTPHTVYVADAFGVFRALEGSTDWTEVGSNLPHSVVTDLQIDSAKRVLAASAEGRGVWEIALPEPTNLALSSDQPSGTYGQSIILTASVTPAAGTEVPTGSVQFTIDNVGAGAPVALTNGTATLSVPALSAGHHGIIATYVSDTSDFVGSASPGPLTQDIAPAPLTITASSLSKMYGDPLPALTVSYAGFVNGDGLASLSVAPAISTSATPASGVGSFPITVSGASAANYSITFQPGTLTITPAPLTITADDEAKPYGADPPTLTVHYDGFINGDSPASLTVAPTTSTSATPASGVGSFPITVSGASAANYSITFQPGTLTITPAPLTITADDQAKLYGAELPTLTFRFDGFVNGDSPASLTAAPSVSTTATAASHVGSYPIAVASAAAANYTITFAPGTLTVTQAPLTITADDQTKVYGAVLPVLPVRYAGFVNGDSAASLTTAPVVSTMATAGSGVGTYALTPAGGVDNDYSITLQPGTLTVTPAPLTITADDQMKVYGAALPTLTVRYSGFVNGDTPANLSAAAVVSTTVNEASGVGSYTITVGAALAANYTINFQPGTLTVTPAPLTITADDQTKLYGATLPALTARYAGFVNGDGPSSLTTAPALTTTATAASGVGLYSITVAGASAANYLLAYQPGSLSTAPAPLTITAQDATKVYGAPLPSFSVAYAGFVNGDTPANLTASPSVSTTATAASGVSEYPITAAGAAAPNYMITFQPGTLTVTPAPLTISADNQTKTYGAPLPALTVSYAGFVNGDTPGSLSTAPLVQSAATSASGVGQYPLTAASAAAANYAITYQPGVLTIAPAPLTIGADSRTMTYGSNLPALTATYTGLVSGDSPGQLAPAILTTTATARSGAGSYPIAVSGVGGTNYVVTFVPGTLTIVPAPLIVMVDNQTIVAGTPLPSLTVHFTGFVNGDTAASLLSAPTVVARATAASGAGTYALTASGAADPNYTISYVAGNLTILPAAPSLSVPNQLKVLGQSVSFMGKGLKVSDADPQASIKVQLTTSLGTFRLHAAGVTIVGNQTGSLTLTGNAAALNRALNMLSLSLKGSHRKGTISITVKHGNHTTRSILKVVS